MEPNKYNPAVNVYYQGGRSQTDIIRLIATNRFEEALDICNEYIERKNNGIFRNDYIYRAKCYEKMKEYKKAIEDYTQAIKLISYEYSEEYEEFYHLRALCYQKLKQYDNALKDHSEAIKRNRRHKGIYPDIYFKYRAKCYKEMGERKKADADYERAINRYTNELEDNVKDRYYYEYGRRSKEISLALRADCYKSMGKIKSAIEDYTELIQSKTSFTSDVAAGYYSGRGDCYKLFKQYDKAIEDYTSAIRLNSHSNEDYIKRADCYMELKDCRKAADDYTKAIEIYPYEWTYYYNRAKCFFELGEISKMRDDYNYLLSNPDNKLYGIDIKKCDFLNEKLKLILSRPVEIKTCTRQEIMSIEGINSLIADKFIELRNSGAMWYNIEAFVNDLNIQPHLINSMKDRLVFPLKPVAKTGRRIDF